MSGPRRLAWDWHPGTIPGNVMIDETAYVETSLSFDLFRSSRETGLRYGRGASTYKGTMFDVGPNGRVTIGDYALVHGARIICDDDISIGDYALISWNVVLMDTYRLPFDADERRRALEQVPTHEPRVLPGGYASPIRLERNTWIGFGVCVLPGVTVGEGSIVGANSVVVESIPPFTIAAGNPARVIRSIEP